MVLLTALLTIFSVLRTPSFQELAGRLAADFLSKQFQTGVFLEKLKIADLSSLEIHGLKVNDIHQREMIRIADLKVKINSLSLKRHIIEFERVSLGGAGLFLQKYPGDSIVNFGYFLEGFKSDTIVTSDTTVTWSFFCNELAVVDLSFNYRIDQPEYLTEGIDFNDLSFSEISLDLNDISIISDSFAAFVGHVACMEKSGLELLNFSGDARVSSSGIRVKNAQVSTGQSSLDLDLDFLYNGYDNLSEFLDSVRINATIRRSLLTLSDIGYFAPELFKMDDPVMLSGLVEGPVSNFSASDLNISLGEFTEFNGNVSMKGLPDIYSTFVKLDIKKLNTTPDDLTNFNLPLENPNLELPSQVLQLGFTSIRGKFEGYYDDFKTDLDIRSDAGNVRVNGSLASQHAGGEMIFSGDIIGTGVQIGSLLNNDLLGTVDLEMEFDGKGSAIEKLDMDINGWVQNLEFKGYRYEKIIFGGVINARSYEGRLIILDPSLQLDFNGLANFNGEFPAFDFSLDVEEASFYKLNLAERSEDMSLKGLIRGNFKGIDPESFYGNISIDSLQYVENNTKYTLQHLGLERKRVIGQPDSITLRSDYVDGDIEGIFTMKELSSQLTDFILGHEEDLAMQQERKENPQYISFHFILKDLSPVTEIFLPYFEISPDAVIKGYYDSGKQFLEVDGWIDSVSVSGIHFEDVVFSGSTAQNEFNLDLGISNIVIQENSDGTELGIDNLSASFVAGRDSIQYALIWDNKLLESPNRGSIDGFVRYKSMQYLEAGIYKAEANFNGKTWRVEKDNLLTLDTNFIGIQNFHIYRGEESFFVNGSLSDRPEDTLSLFFEKWSLANFNPFIAGTSLEMSGIINGRFGIFRQINTISIFGGINITDFTLNKVFYGDVEFKTHWLESEKAMAVNLNILSKGTMDDPYKILGVNGNYYPFDETRNFDFDITAQNLNISVLEPLLESFSSHLEGIASGKLTLDGTTAKPLLLGRLKLQRAEMMVDYLNVKYSFSNEVVFKENLIQFNELTVFDPNSNTALLTGGIEHNYFQDMHLDLTIKPDKFMAMDIDRYQNEFFYGKAFATGTVRLSGPFTNLFIEVDARTERGTKVFIPINYSVDVSQNDFIVFTSEDDTNQLNIEVAKPIIGVSLNIGMNVTNDADIEIFLPGNIGNIRAKGNGRLRLGIDPNGYLTLNGSYIIQSGLFVFSLEQLVSRRFDILEGSKISWTGDINNAEVKIVARYRLRTSLDGLGITMIDPEAASQKVIVNTDIRMSGNLFNPELTFGITFPNMQEQLRQTIYAVLDTSDIGVMNQQAISLLVLGSFSSTGSGGTNPVSGAAIVSNTLSNMLSQISNDFNVGINYIPGDQVSSEQLEVALSTQLLDDRLIIDGNLGVSGSDASSQKTSSIVGDINIEYKLTPDGRFRVKAFNRSNDLSLFNDYAPYTQGVGVFYRKEFNNLSELFKRSVSPKQKKNKN